MATKELTLQKVEAVSIAKLVGAFNGIIGVIVGAISAIVALISVIAHNNYDIPTSILVSLGILLGGIIFYPIFTYALGWLYGWVLGTVFNFISEVSGGISITAVEKSDSKK